MIQHENTLQNYRITWLMTIQGLLFTALGFAWDKRDARPLVLIFSLLGTVVAVSCWTALRIGSKAFVELDTWWEAHKGEYPGPAAYGHKAPEAGLLWHLRPWRLLPWVFVCGWLAVFVIGTTRPEGAIKSKVVIDQERQLDTFKADFK